MAKLVSRISSRRILCPLTVLCLFLLYLFFDIDYLIVVDVEDDDAETLRNPFLISQPREQDNSDPQDIDTAEFGKQIVDIESPEIETTKIPSPSDPDIENKTPVTPPSELTEFSPPTNRTLFDRTEWRHHRITPNLCPYFEDVCVHKQHFYVFDRNDTFKLHPKFSSNHVYGDRVKHANPSFDILSNVFNARIWNRSDINFNEFERSHCLEDPLTENHFIMSFKYTSMTGEFYLQTLSTLHWLFNELQVLDKESRNYKFYLMLPENAQILLSHRMFMERFSKFEILRFIDLFEHYRCRCVSRLFFCGFQQTLNPKHHQNDDAESRWLLSPLRSPTVSRGTMIRQINMNRVSMFKDMISEYDQWVDANHPDLEDDVKIWKNETLKQCKACKVENVSEWRFIGLYQRDKRRKWRNLPEIQRECNERYREHNILCIEINLETIGQHSKDILVLHRAMTMLIGVHGATLTDAVWMQSNAGNYVIELLPFDSPDWVSSIREPTLSAILFWQSTFNYVGLKLSNTSIFGGAKLQSWADRDFKVSFKRLSRVIDFLLIDDGGYCQKYQSADRIEVPPDINEMGFAIYNAFCPQTPDVIHNYVRMRIID